MRKKCQRDGFAKLTTDDIVVLFTKVYRGLGVAWGCYSAQQVVMWYSSVGHSTNDQARARGKGGGIVLKRS